MRDVPVQVPGARDVISTGSGKVVEGGGGGYFLGALVNVEDISLWEGLCSQ